jgi:hypothetical protein
MSNIDRVRTAETIAGQVLNARPNRRFIVPAFDDGPFARWAVFQSDNNGLTAIRVVANDSWRGPLIRQDGEDLPVLTVTGFLGTAIAHDRVAAAELVRSVVRPAPRVRP